MRSRENLRNEKVSLTDWERIKQESDSNAPIPYDPEDGPYDPNDEVAFDEFVTKAEIWSGYPNQVLVKPAGKPVRPAESDPADDSEPEAKAS